MTVRPAHIYGAIFLAAALLRVALEFVAFDYPLPGQRAVWSWPFFLVFTACLGTGIVFAARGGLPSPGEALGLPRAALALPLIVGVAVALLTIASDALAPVAVARGLPTVHVEGLAAIPFYAYGAIVLTTVFHFLPVAVLAWLALRLSGAPRTVLTGVGIGLIALGEDAGYFLGTRASLDLDWARHALSVLANGAEAVFILRFGLLAGLVQRASTYLVWHLLWPEFGPA